jgi:hypothetical protein
LEAKYFVEAMSCPIIAYSEDVQTLGVELATTSDKKELRHRYVNGRPYGHDSVHDEDQDLVQPPDAGVLPAVTGDTWLERYLHCEVGRELGAGELPEELKTRGSRPPMPDAEWLRFDEPKPEEETPAPEKREAGGSPGAVRFLISREVVDDS